MEGGNLVGQLSDRDIKGGRWILIQAYIVHVRDDSDNMSRRLGEDGIRPGADYQHVPTRICFRPLRLGHRVVNEDDSSCGTTVMLRKVAASHNWYFERFEVAPRYWEETTSTS